MLRLLGVLGIVAGVFAMHGLTGQHDAAMAIMHLPGVTQTGPTPAAPAVSSPAEAMASEAMTTGLSRAGESAAGHSVRLPIALVDGFDRVAIGAAGEQHGMAGACMAVLTTLLLLLALMLGLRSLRAWRSVVLLAPTERLTSTDRSPPWLAPSLSTSGVLRI